VTYRSNEDTTRVAAMKIHIISGKQVQVKLAQSKEQTRMKLILE